MARPPKAVKSVTKELSLPPEIVAQVDLELYSELEGRVPHAAWQKLLTSLLGSWLEARKTTAALADYKAKLIAHDWLFEFSDDQAVWAKGRVQLQELRELQEKLDPERVIWKQVIANVV